MDIVLISCCMAHFFILIGALLNSYEIEVRDYHPDKSANACNRTDDCPEESTLVKDFRFFILALCAISFIWLVAFVCYVFCR